MPRPCSPFQLLQCAAALTLCLALPAHGQQAKQPAPDPNPDSETLRAAGRQTIDFLLHHVIIDPRVLVPETGKPLPTTGEWSANPERPSICPESAIPCLRIFYSLPETTVVCEWVVLLSAPNPPPNPTTPTGQTAAQPLNPTILEQNGDATRYTYRRVLASEAAPLILTRVEPSYPPIAANHAQGTVEVVLLVGPTGEPTTAVAVSGPEILRGISRLAAKQWRFKPLNVGDTAAPFQLAIKFTFVAPTKKVAAAITSEP